MRRPLPYAFARTHQLLLEDDGHTLTLWHSDAPDLSAWSEITRTHAVQAFEYLDKATLAKRISEAYAQADSNAAAASFSAARLVRARPDALRPSTTLAATTNSCSCCRPLVSTSS